MTTAFLQLLLAIFLMIWASLRVLKFRRGRTALCWLLFIWLMPVMGAILVLVLVQDRRQKSRD